jgi:DNA-binding NtrC family response regulator
LSGKKKISVLLVDDDPNMQRMVSIFFAKDDINLDIAENGRSALKRISENNYDILITDMQMPLMDGMELIGKIKKLKYKFPIIVISAFGQEDVINKYKTIGAFEVIQKPFDSKRLKQVIEKAIKN